MVWYHGHTDSAISTVIHVYIRADDLLENNYTDLTIAAGDGPMGAFGEQKEDSVIKLQNTT